MLGMALVLVAESVSARPPAAVTKAQSTATIFITVPLKVKPVSYVFDGKLWTARSQRGLGETITLPAAATSISLSRGAIITSSVPSADGGEAVKVDYTVTRPITLKSLTAAEIREIGPYLMLGAVTFEASGKAVATTIGQAGEDEAPLLAAPKQTKAPDCEAIYSAVKKFIKGNPEKVLELVALQVGQHETCACEIVKAAIIASDADKELVMDIVETAIETAPSQFRIIGQCAIAVAPDALAEVQFIVSQYGSVSGDSGLGAKGGEKWSEKGDGKGGAGRDIFQQPLVSSLPSAAMNDLANAVDMLSTTTVNPFNVLEDIVTDSNARFVGSTKVRLPNPVLRRTVVIGGSTAAQADVDRAMAQHFASLGNVGNKLNDNLGGSGYDTEKGGDYSDEKGGHSNNGEALSAVASVIGEVIDAGDIRLPSSGKIDILTAIAVAGGYGQQANRNECILRRYGTSTREAMKVNLRDIRSRKQPMIYVYEGDIVTIKKVRF